MTRARRHAPIVVVDIAVPRDAEPAIGKLDGVYLFDIDDLEKVVAQNLAGRQREAEAAEKIVAAEVVEFRKWHGAQAVVTFSHVVRPPCARGMTWSKVSSLRSPQYWQENLSRRNRLNRVKAGYSLGLTNCLSAMTEGSLNAVVGLWTSRS